MTQIINIHDLIEFPNQGILSKTISERSTGEVDLFILPKGEELSRHTSSRDAAVYLIRGEADFQLGEQWHRVKSGDWFIMPAGLEHALNAVEDLVFMLTLFGG
jgi:quercetin dioxygenase-like cupin family protein